MSDTPVVITKTDDHDLLIEVRTEIKAIREQLTAMRDDLKTKVDDHESRLRALEMSSAQGKGTERIITAVISLIAAGVVTYIVKVLTHH